MLAGRWSPPKRVPILQLGVLFGSLRAELPVKSLLTTILLSHLPQSSVQRIDSRRRTECPLRCGQRFPIQFIDE